MTEPSSAEPQASDTKPEAEAAPKPGSKPDAKDDLKSLPMAEVEENWARPRTGSRRPRRKNG